MRLDITLTPADLTACVACGTTTTLGQLHDLSGMGRVCEPCIRAEVARTTQPRCGGCGGSTADYGGAEFCSWQCSVAWEDAAGLRGL